MRSLSQTCAGAGTVERLQIFASHGERTSVGGDSPFLLEGDQAYLIEEGLIDIFAVRVAGGRLVGPRSHLLRLPAGHIFLGLSPNRSPEGRGFLVVGTAGTRLLKQPQATLRHLAGDPRHATAITEVLEAWIEALCAGVARDVVPKRCIELDVGREIAVPGSTNARPRRSISWVKHLQGRSYLLGKEALEMNGDGYTPLSRRAWVEVREPSRLLLVETGALGESQDLWSGLERLTTLVLRSVDLMAHEADRRDHERMQQKTNFERSVLRRAYGRLAAAVGPPETTARSLESSTTASTVDPEDSLFTACRLVAESLGIAIKPYPRIQGTRPPRDPFDAILRASRIRSRLVALRGNWWRHDCGPLLGRSGEKKHPVALFPTPKGYALYDPERRIVEPVGPATAATLVPFAHTFYRPFPDGALRLKDVLCFGLRGCGSDVRFLLFISIAAAILGTIPSMATGIFFNTVIPGAHRSEIVQLSAVLLASAVASSLLSLAQGIAFLRIEGRAGAAIQSAVWDRLLSLPLSFFRPYTAGDLAVRAMSIDAIRQVFSGSTATALMGGLCSLGNVGLLFYYSVEMAWRATAMILFVMAVTIAGGYLQLSPQRGALKLQAKASGIVLQLLTSISKIRVAGVEPSAFALWAGRFSQQRQLQYRARAIAIWVSAFDAAVPVTANLLIFWVAWPLMTTEHSLRTGDFLAFLSAFSACTTALLSTCLAVLAMGNVVPLYEHAKPILDTAPEGQAGKSDPGSLAGDIEIQHAVFRYGLDSPLILRDVSLRIGPGEFVALVGPSGSGKSTLLRLLLGFETLDSGAIYYDGQDLKGLDVHVVRRQIGVVIQNGRLMSGDIFTNIVGSSAATLDEAWEAARMAGFSEDIEAMPMGMHTVIGEGGGTLSGGQRQRLLIARAIVRRPRLLLFDEATSALDNRTQAIVSASLEQLQATRVVVAHRLSTIRNADRVYVLERGSLVQSGTYEDLISQPGLFADLARRQIA